MNGRERAAVDKNDLASMIDAICDGAMDEDAQPSAELLALRRAAALALFETNTPDDGWTGVDPDRLTGAIATLASGLDEEASRRIVAQAALRSAQARLDTEAAFAFVQSVEHQGEAAPAEAVEELLATHAVTARTATGVRGNLWRRILAGLLQARGFRVAAACMVVLLASAASWSLLWRQQPEQVEAPAPPVAKTESDHSRVVLKPAPKPMLRAAQPCELDARSRDELKQRNGIAAGPEPSRSHNAADCVLPATDEAADVALKSASEKAKLGKPGDLAEPAGQPLRQGETMRANSGSAPAQSRALPGTTPPAAAGASSAPASAAKPSAPALSR